MGVSRLSGTELVPKCQGIHDKVVGNAKFPSPIPTSADFQKLIDDLAAANSAAETNGGKAEHQARRVAMVAMKAAVKGWMGYVQNASGGNADAILSSGFEVVKRGTPVGELNPPQNLGVRFTTMSGRASIHWKRENGADMHHVFMSTSNDPFNWQLIGATTKSRFNADSLEPGRVYWFAVTALGTAGETSKSEPLLARAA